MTVAMTDRTDVVTRVGGAIVNGVIMSTPMAALTATSKSLRIDTFPGGRYEFRVEQIKRLRLRWRYLRPAIGIEHTRSDAPRDLWFLPWWRPALVRELVRLGYRVTR